MDAETTLLGMRRAELREAELREAEREAERGRAAAAAAPAVAETHFALAERRRVLRSPVIKSARLITGGEINQSVYNCLVLDESPSGALVDLGAVFELPAEMELQMTGGASRRARRCWAVGTRLGLAFIGAQAMSAETAEKMAQLGREMQAQGLPATMVALRARHFFESDELRRAAEAAEAAWHRLEAILLG